MTEHLDKPLILQALPPETDYLTYLTILEYNLNKEQLPLLHELLQDTTLTTNIGWDLVHLLLPLLPESDQCLQDISFLGNPRETILKVAESLEELAVPSPHDTGNNGHEAEGNAEVLKTSGLSDNLAQPEATALKFQSLLHMLCILHPRIKTKHPGRFLVTSLQAALKAFSAVAQAPSAISSILMLLKSLSGSKRPHLPPRRSQQAIPTVSTRNAAPDPEGQLDIASPEDDDINRRILQSVATQIVDVYLRSLSFVEDDSALAWTSRYFEKSRPARIVPGRITFRERFKQQEELERRDATISQLLAVLDNDINFPWNDVFAWLLEKRDPDRESGAFLDLSDFPPSSSGALFCTAARVASALLNDRPVSLPLSVFPEHAMLVEAYIDLDPESIDYALIDSLLILGWAALDSNSLGNSETRSEFHQYLQRLSFLAANTPFSSLRFQVHVYLSAVLRSEPSSDARLDFIQDTLEHCPYENIRVAAVGLLKDETLEAFGMTTTNNPPSTGFPIKIEEGDQMNVFSEPSTFKSCAPWLFATPDIEDDHALLAGLPFWLAVVNLLYLLSSSSILRESLNIRDIVTEFNAEREFLDILEELIARSKSTSGSNQNYRDFQGEMWAIEDSLARVRQVL